MPTHPLRLFSTLGRSLTDVTPHHPDGVVRVYHCGPTVYATPHLGNLRRSLVADLLVRTLQFLGYSVRSVMNITDVGHLLERDQEAAGADRMVVAAQREGLRPEEIAAKYTQEFFGALTAVRAEPAQYYPRATMHIPQMIALTQTLVERGIAYVTPSGVYLDVTLVPDYGRLSGNTLDALKTGARVQTRGDKRHPADFALWVIAPREHLMQWDSPWGRGYPGWHIECSAMAMHSLGEMLDIHTGGEDNIFPHHENEIAQSEAVTRAPFASIWMHNAHLLLVDAKMAKSEGTVVTLADLATRGIDPLAFRLLTLQTHYRSKLSFTWKSMEGAARALESLRVFVQRLGPRQETGNTKHERGNRIAEHLSRLEDAFTTALANDLGAPQALAALFDFIREINPLLERRGVRAEDCEHIRSRLRHLDRVLALLDVDAVSLAAEIPDTVRTLVRAREDARQRKEFTAADRLRNEIAEAGFRVEDTPAGPRVTPLRAAPPQTEAETMIRSSRDGS